MADNFDAAKSKAEKILGKDGKIPVPKSLDKLRSEWFVAYDAYEKARDDLEDKILTLQKAGSNAKLTLTQYGDKLDDEDFGLDEKNKDDAKKIKDAHDIMDAWLQNIFKNVDVDIDGLADLVKHLVDFKKYKSKQA